MSEHPTFCSSGICGILCQQNTSLSQ
jgi:hypothetical protein